MFVKKNVIFTIRFDDETNRIIRRLAFNNSISAGSLVRRVVKSYLVSKGYIQGLSK